MKVGVPCCYKCMQRWVEIGFHEDVNLFCRLREGKLGSKCLSITLFLALNVRTVETKFRILISAR